MNSWFFGPFAIALTLALTLTTGGVASACPVGFDDVPRRRPPVNNVSFQASELLERANRVESVAAAREESARSRETRAATLMSRARVLRNQASLVGFSEQS